MRSLPSGRANADVQHMMETRYLSKYEFEARSGGQEYELKRRLADTFAFQIFYFVRNVV